MSKTLSIVIPFYNEGLIVGKVLGEVISTQPDAEVIAIDDGSTDNTWEEIGKWPTVKKFRLTTNMGQSAAIYLGMQAASSPYIGLMDGDGQNDPRDLSLLLDAVQNGKGDVAVGYRLRRQDKWSRRIAGKVANKVRRLFLQDGVRDTGCSLKVFSRDAVGVLIPFNGLHRYLPAFFHKAGLKVVEYPVNHRPRAGGISKYTNLDRAIRGVYDLVGVGWYLRRMVIVPSLDSSR